jgi:hypothetical protein
MIVRPNEEEIDIVTGTVLHMLENKCIICAFYPQKA